jgi:quercetin dioxygenase-like cupin family protein
MRKAIAVTVAVVAPLAVVATALATTPSGIMVTTFVRATLDGNRARGGVKVSADHVQLRTKGATDVAMQVISSPAGASSGWHSHPGVVLVAVQSGTVTRYDSHCRATQFGPGQSFVESGNRAVLVRNNTTSDALLYVTLIVPKSAPLLRIERPQPAGCAVS